MAKRDAFIKDFKKLLKSIPSNYSLPQWQFAYRQVLYSMGMKILENFPGDVVGPDPSRAPPPGPQPVQSPGKSGPVGIAGQGGGIHQTVCKFVCVVLDVTPTGGNPPPGPL